MAWPYAATKNDEPFTLGGAIAAATERVGIVVTATTTFEPPFTIARQTLGLDHLSSGRAGLNIVTSAGDETAVNFTREPLPSHAARYAIAEEALEVITGLWDGFGDATSLPARVDGRINEVSEIRTVDHDGPYFRLDGLLGMQRSVQGRPVLFQAGSSEAGARFAARHADVVFSGHRELADARRFRERIIELADAAGRESPPLVLPGLYTIVGRDDDEVERNLNAILDSLVLQVKLGGLKEIGIDFSGLSLDDPLPPLPEGTERHQTGLARYRRIAERLGPVTIRRFLQETALTGYFARSIGTYTQAADLVQQRFEEGAADGFVLFPGGNSFTQMRLFAENVVPILQERGLFRTSYEGTTLRDRLGLARPERSGPASTRTPERTPERQGAVS